VRRLVLAGNEEAFIQIKVDGSPLTDPQDAKKLDLEMRVKSGGWKIHGASQNNRTIVESPNPPFELPDSLRLGEEDTAGLATGIEEDLGETELGNGLIWGGMYEIQLISEVGTDCAWLELPSHSVDLQDENGDFLDRPANDYIVDFLLDSELNCIDQSIEIKPGGGTPVSPPSPLTLSVTAPESVGVNQNFTATASPSGGFGFGHKFAFTFDAAGGSSETFTGDLGSSSAAHTYSQSGTFKIRAVVRDGNDNVGHGGNYALSPARTITVVPPRDAVAAGHTLPDTVEALEWVATSVNMTNTGGDTWSGTDYKLKQSRNQVWVPTTVSLDGASVALNETHTFNFNLKSLEPEELGFQDNFWKMSHVGTLFGEENGQQTYVAAEGSLSAGWLEWIGKLARWLSPRRAFAGWPSWRPGAQEEVVQRLRLEDVPIPAGRLAAEGEVRLRYLASLEEPWDVDFRFHLVFDPAVVDVGPVVRGPRSAGYRVRVERLAPGEVVVTGTREGVPGLDGAGTIVEIPLVLEPGAEAPSTLPLVELVATR